MLQLDRSDIESATLRPGTTKEVMIRRARREGVMMAGEPPVIE